MAIMKSYLAEDTIPQIEPMKEILCACQNELISCQIARIEIHGPFPVARGFALNFIAEHLNFGQSSSVDGFIEQIVVFHQIRAHFSPIILGKIKGYRAML